MAQLLIEALFGSANEQSGIEASAIRGKIPLTNLPDNLPTNGDGTRFSFLRKVKPSTDITLTTPAGDDQGGWTQWTTLETIPNITAAEAGHVLIVSNMTVEVSATAVGGGSRLHSEARLMRTRGSVTTELERVIGYGPRHLPAASGQTSVSFSNSTNYASKIMVNIDEAQAGDSYKVEVRVVWQKTSGTIDVTFPSRNNFIEVAPLGGAAGSSNPRTDSEINNLITNFLNALPTVSIANLKNQLSILSSSDTTSLLLTELNSLPTNTITALKNSLGVKSDEDIRTIVENDLDVSTVKRILEAIPDKTVKADYLKDIHINFGDTLPTNLTDLPDGMLFLVRGTGWVYVLKPSTKTAVQNRNRASVTIANDIFELDNGRPQDNPNDLIGRVENANVNNTRRLEIFLREDLLSNLNINTDKDSNVKFYAEINGSTIGLHRYSDATQIRFPDLLENVRWIEFSAPAGTTVTLTNNQSTNISFYRDSAKTNPLNIKPEFTYSGKSFQRVTGETQPDLSNYLTQNQIEGLIKSEQDEGEKLLDFNFTGTAGSIDRTAVNESPALSNSFTLGDTNIVIKKIVQFTGDNTIEITTTPSLYTLTNNVQDPNEDLIEAFKDIKIKVNDLILSFGAAIASVNSSGYSWDVDQNETYWQFDGREPNVVRIGNNKIEIFSPLEPFNFVPKGSAQDNGRTLKWNNATERSEWLPEAGLDQSVTDQLEDQKNFEEALRYRTSLGSSSIRITQPGIGQNTSKRVPAQRTGKDDHFILSVAGQEYQFSAADIYAKPRTPIGSLTSSNALEFGDTTKFFIARSTGSVQDFLFSASVAGTYNIIIYSYNIDLNDESRASTGTFSEKVETALVPILNVPGSEIAINHINAANHIEMDIKAGVVTPAKFAGDTAVGSKLIVTNPTLTGFTYHTPNISVTDSALSSFSLIDTATQNSTPVVISPDFDVTQNGNFLVNLEIEWTRGATAARMNPFGDRKINRDAVVFSRTLQRSTARTRTNTEGVSVVVQPLYVGTTLLGEYIFYLAKDNNNHLNHWESFRYHSGQSGGNKNFELGRYLTLSFQGFLE